VADFEGQVIDSLALARRAEGLGYLRGPFEGHNWFQLYRRPFSRAGVEALIWFSGNQLHENHPVALRKLSFARLDPELRSSHPAAELASGRGASGTAERMLERPPHSGRSGLGLRSGMEGRDGMKGKMGW
jgi:hypothetical protein